MSVRIDTYSLLVEKFGEATAYDICEKLGGTQIKIPKKAHRTFRARRLITRALPYLKAEEKKRLKLVKIITKYLEIDESSVYRIIREIEDDERKKKS